MTGVDFGSLVFLRKIAKFQANFSDTRLSELLLLGMAKAGILINYHGLES